MNSFIILLTILFKYFKGLTPVILSYGLMYLPFTKSLEETTLFVKFFVFSGGLALGIILSAYLSVIEKEAKKKETLFVPSDIKDKVYQLMGTGNEPKSIEAIVSTVFKSEWYTDKQQKTKLPEELAILVLFLIHQINAEREVKFVTNKEKTA